MKILNSKLIGNKIFLLSISSYSNPHFLKHSLYLHKPYQYNHSHQYNFSGLFSSSIAIFYKYKMLVKLLKIQDFYDFTLCINAMHSTVLPFSHKRFLTFFPSLYIGKLNSIDFNISFESFLGYI